MEELLMSAKERKRLIWLSRVKDGEATLAEAVLAVELSYRHLRRLLKRYRQQGEAGLVHRLRGRPSARRIAEAMRQRILQRYQEHYAGWGATHAAEFLAREGLKVDHETLRRWLKAKGVALPSRRRASYRQRRPRKPHAGQLVQMDGSLHDWFEGRRSPAVLMVLIDDATNRPYARFFEAETTWASFESFEGYVQLYGLPAALYVDRDSIYRSDRQPTLEEQCAGQRPVTQLGRAMSELAVGLILAHSPQAKGRVERRHGVFEDRLVKELCRAAISTLEEANGYLEEEFLPRLNRHMTVPAAAEADWHRPLPRGVKLAEVLCVEESRRVERDWTLSWQGRRLQIRREHAPLSLAGRRVVVRQLRDGRLQLVYRKQKLSWQLLPPAACPAPPQPMAATPRLADRPKAASKIHQELPAAPHPWRRFGIAASQKFLKSGGARGGGPSPRPPAPRAGNNNSSRGHF